MAYTKSRLQVSRLVPSFVIHAIWYDILPVVNRCSVFIQTVGDLHGEFDLWKHKWVLKESTASSISTAPAALSSCMKEVFLSILIFLHILTVLPVTADESGRVFSEVEKTLTSISSSMNEER